MPYYFCILNREAIKDSNRFSEKNYADNPELVCTDPVQCSFKVSVIGITNNLNIDYLTISRLFYPNHQAVQVLYCLKSDLSLLPRYADHSQLPIVVEQFNINSPQEVVGCIVFSLPRIGDGTSYCVGNTLAAPADYKAFIEGVEASQSKSKIVKEMVVYERQFKLPAAMKSLSSPLPSLTEDKTKLVSLEPRRQAYPPAFSISRDKPPVSETKNKTYYFCILNREAIKDSNRFSEKNYADNPELVCTDPVQCSFKVSVIGVTNNLNIDYLTISRLFYPNHQCIQVLYCLKSAPPPLLRYADHSQLPIVVEQFNISSPEEVVGCIVFSPPRIGDGTSYCVGNMLAAPADYKTLIEGVQASQSKSKFVKEMVVYERQFKLPASLFNREQLVPPALPVGQGVQEPVAEGPGGSTCSLM